MTALLVGATALVSRQAGAQQEDPYAGWRATVVTTNRLPTGTNVAVIRRAHVRPQQLILVGPNATAGDLLRAVGTLGALRAHDGDQPRVDVQVVPSASLPRGPGFAEEAARFQSFLDALRGAPARAVPGIGISRAVELDLGPSPTINR